jgi:hypothetical protein
MHPLGWLHPDLAESVLDEPSDGGVVASVSSLGGGADRESRPEGGWGGSQIVGELEDRPLDGQVALPSAEGFGDQQRGSGRRQTLHSETLCAPTTMDERDRHGLSLLTWSGWVLAEFGDAVSFRWFVGRLRRRLPAAVVRAGSVDVDFGAGLRLCGEGPELGEGVVVLGTVGPFLAGDDVVQAGDPQRDTGCTLRFLDRAGKQVFVAQSGAVPGRDLDQHIDVARVGPPGRDLHASEHQPIDDHRQLASLVTGQPLDQHECVEFPQCLGDMGKVLLATAHNCVSVEGQALCAAPATPPTTR